MTLSGIVLASEGLSFRISGDERRWFSFCFYKTIKIYDPWKYSTLRPALSVSMAQIHADFIQICCCRVPVWLWITRRRQRRHSTKVWVTFARKVDKTNWRDQTKHVLRWRLKCSKFFVFVKINQTNPANKFMANFYPPSSVSTISSRWWNAETFILSFSANNFSISHENYLRLIRSGPQWMTDFISNWIFPLNGRR